ncbi:MAG: tetratricopeptide repeat protein [Bacillota bacterium]
MEASRFDPFSADIKATLASLKNAQKDREAAVDYMNAALARSPYDASLYSSLSDIHLTYGEIESAIESGKKAVRCAPWLVSSYESLTNAYVEGGIESLTNGDVDGARKYFSECSSIPQLLNENAEKIPEKAQKLWRDRDKFMALNPAVKLNIGISQIYLGQYGEAEESLKPALENEETKAEASFWQAVLAEKRGQTADAEKYLQQADENLAGQFETLVGLTAVPKE